MIVNVTPMGIGMDRIDLGDASVGFDTTKLDLCHTGRCQNGRWTSQRLCLTCTIVSCEELESTMYLCSATQKCVAPYSVSILSRGT